MFVIVFLWDFFVLLLQHKVLNRRLRPLGDDVLEDLCWFCNKERAEGFFLMQIVWLMILEYHYPFLVQLFGLWLLTSYVFHVKASQVLSSSLRYVGCASSNPGASCLIHLGSHGCHSVSFLTYLIHFFSSCFSSHCVQAYLTLAFVHRGR